MAKKMLLLFLLAGCNFSDDLITNPDYISNGFDYPVGKPNAKGYYDAQPFGKNNHLGSDWNGNGGGNTDFGDNIYAISNGYVKYAKKAEASWGNVIRIIHTLPNGEQVESLYAHCDKILVKKGSWVKKGQKIGTIGTCDGRYLAHLHFEIRDDINKDIGGGYSWFKLGYLNPTKFIEENRKSSK